MKRTISVLAAAVMMTLSSCSNLNIGFGGYKYEDNTSQSISVTADGLSTLVLDNTVGSCTITCADVDEAQIKTSCTYRAHTRKKLDYALDNFTVSAKSDGETLSVEFVDSKTGKRLSSKNDRSTRRLNYVTDIEIILPEYFAEFNVSTDVGSIELSAASGAFDLKSDVGDVTVSEVSITGDSEMSTDVGSISAALAEVSSSKLRLTTDVGDIELIKGEHDIGEQKFDNDVTGGSAELIIDGICSVGMKTDVGEINIK